MTSWTGIVLALEPAGSDEMVSRLMTCLHPVAGRPLIWHTVAGLTAVQPAPHRIVIASVIELPEELFQGLPVEVEVCVVDEGDLSSLEDEFLDDAAARAIIIQANAPVLTERLQTLFDQPEGGWLEADSGEAAAAVVDLPVLPQLLRLPDPLTPPNGVLSPMLRLDDDGPALLVRNRLQLAQVEQRVREQTVKALMLAGVTFIQPDNVSVDVDVRIGRDTIVYPGVVLEGQTTIGEETVIGPGCRVIDSWIGSGVEMKGWNYVSHASIRNRAILEPYVRRGFD